MEREGERSEGEEERGRKEGKGEEGKWWDLEVFSVFVMHDCSAQRSATTVVGEEYLNSMNWGNQQAFYIDPHVLHSKLW